MKNKATLQASAHCKAQDVEEYQMKRFNKFQTTAVVILSLCALQSARAQQPNARLGNEQEANKPRVFIPIQQIPTSPAPPRSIDDVLADPIFSLDENVSKRKLCEATAELFQKYARFVNESLPTKLYNEKNPVFMSQEERLEKLKELKKETDDAFYKKVDAVIMPRLVEALKDDDYVLTHVVQGRGAFDACLQTLKYFEKDDEIAAFHEIELARSSKLQESNDNSAKRLSRSRLMTVDKYYLTPALSVEAPYVDLARQAALLDQKELRESLVKLGDKLIEEVKRDPYLVANCCQVYRITLKFVDEDLALQYREKFRESIDKDAALNAYKQINSGEVKLDDVAIWRDDSFDESILEIPGNMTFNESMNLLKDLKERARIAEQAVVPRAVIDDFQNKASIAIARLVVLNMKTSEIAQQSNYRDYDLILELALTRDGAKVLRQAIDEESAKPFDEANGQFLSVARVILLNSELKEAVKSHDRTAVLNVFERFAARADFSVAAERALMKTLQNLVVQKNEFASELVDIALDKSSVSNGRLALQTPPLVNLKAAIKGTADSPKE